MAPLIPYLAAIVALLPALAVPAWIALRGTLAQRLVAVQLATSLAALILVLMTFAFDQPSFVDLALALVMLVLPGTLIYAVFVERWL